MGESEPRTDLSLTHGICGKCNSELKANPDKELDGIKVISGFFQDLGQSVRLGHPFDFEMILERASLLGIERSDLLMGIIQPLLYQIGNWYDAGEISVAREHLFSQTVEALIQRVRREMGGIPSETADQADVIFGCADGNYHYLGIRFLEIALRDNDISARAIFPSLPLDELLRYAHSAGAKVVGISASLPDQLSSLATIDRSLGKLPGFKPFIIAGGHAVGPGTPRIEGVYYFDGNMGHLVEAIRSHLMNGSSSAA